MLKLLIKIIKPIRIYDNSAKLKRIIFQENRNKIGIYLWYNNITNNFYVGSSINLFGRLMNYFNNSFF